MVEGESPWITFYKKQVFDKNSCVNAFMTGKPGSGKSWAILSQCQQLNPDFELAGNWYFRAAPLMRDIKDYYHNRKTFHKGKIWVMDEAGVDLHNLNYFDEINKGLNIFFQTARHRNYIFFGTVPFLSFISKGVRKLSTVILTADGWNSDNKTTVIPRVNQYNDEFDRFYKKRLIVRTERGLSYCNKILVKRPGRKLVREYEKLKDEFTSDQFDEIANRIEVYENKIAEKSRKNKKKNISISQIKFLNLLQKGYSRKQIMDELGLRNQKFDDTLLSMKDCGVVVRPVVSEKTSKILRWKVEIPKDL